jgi:phospholipid/cholesterol/gamma-HCH transport system substrate-binding protein
MSQKINTTSIGLFIVTGVALGVIGLLLFSSSKMFSKTRDLIVYFDGSLNGLNEGAPVKFRGVTIGSVKRVMARFNQAPGDMAMPVILEIEDNLVRRRLADAAGELFYKGATDERIREERIKAGLRASLQTESLVTGVLYVDIQIDSHAPPPVLHQLEKKYIEIPTEPTQIKQLFNNLASLDIKSLQTNLDGLLTELRSTVSQLNMADISAGVTNLLGSVNRLVTDPDITNALAALRPTLDQYRDLGAKVTSKVDPLVDGVTNTLAEANATLAQIRGAGENLRTMLAPDSPVRNDLDQALEQLAAAGQSISSLADFLKQHPNALIAGRELPKK